MEVGRREISETLRLGPSFLSELFWYLNNGVS